MITPEQAALMTRTNIRAIYRWLEAGRVHYAETPGGSLLVCPDSILKLAFNPDKVCKSPSTDPVSVEVRLES